VQDTFERIDEGMPWQVKALGIVGVPAAIAIYLVWALVSQIAPAILSMNSLLSAHVAQMTTLMGEQTQIKNQNEAIIRILKTSCVNAAKDMVERERCLRD
jgi:hypothetical protein